MRDAKPLAVPPDAAAKARAKSAGGMFAAVGARRIVFVDGAFTAELSDLAALEPGLKISSLADALGRGSPDVAARLGTAGPAEGDVAYALNTAFMGDGAVIEVGAGVQIARPLHLAFVYGSQRAAAVFSRSLVVIEAGAGLTLIESHEGPDGVDYQINTALDLMVGDHACFSHIKVNAEGNTALYLAILSATFGTKANVSVFSFFSSVWLPPSPPSVPSAFV
jgi:Fe-S cluster assembly protein SufD